MTISVGEHQLRVDGVPQAVRGAMAHYWRLDRDAWEGVLDAIVASGSTAVSVYVPWEVHETAPGEFDFGQVDPRKDLDAFLTLCERKGLDLIARPGPQINAELTWFGYPERIITDRSLHAQSAAGAPAVLTQVPKPIPALSYAHDRFFAETARWYDAVCPVLARHTRPNGRLTAVLRHARASHPHALREPINLLGTVDLCANGEADASGARRGFGVLVVGELG